MVNQGDPPEPAPNSESSPSSSPAPTPGPSTLPTAVPFPTPVPPPARVPAPAPAVPNLAGLWRTNSGEIYQFRQSGTQLQFTAQAQGQDIGGGSGELEGHLLRLSMTLSLQGVALGNLNCNMQATPDFRAFGGICSGPTGQFQAQFFR
jgi:hypothetical protein